MKTYDNIKQIPKSNVSGDIIGKPYLLPLQLTQQEDNDILNKTNFHFLKGEGESIPKLSSCKEITDICPGVFLIPRLFSSHADQIKKRITHLKMSREEFKTSLVIYDKEFATTIWESISNSFIKVFHDDKKHEDEFLDSSKPHVNTDIHEAFTLVYGCEQSESSNPSSAIQRDATFIKDRNTKSLYSMVIPLVGSDNYKGIVFHSPKIPSVEIPKGSTVKDEITYHGNLYNHFDHHVPTVKPGDVLIIKQEDVLYQYLPTVAGDSEVCFVKGNIMFHSPESCSNKPLVNNWAYAEQFCNAEKLERDSGDLVGARECLEKVISIRRSPETPLNSQTWSPCYSAEEKSEYSKTTVSCPITTDKAFAFFSMEIWYIIIHFINDFQSVVNLCKVFVQLSPILKESFFERFFRDSFSTSHHVQFQTSDAEYIANNQSQFAKVAAVYSIFLIGDCTDSKKKHNSYLLSMNKDTGYLNELELHDLLFRIFDEGEDDEELREEDNSALFKVRQYERNEKNYKNDLFHSVDRRFMITHFNCHDIGIDVESELCSVITNDDVVASFQEESCLDTYLPQRNSLLTSVDPKNRCTLTAWDRHFEFWKDYYVSRCYSLNNSLDFSNVKRKDKKFLLVNGMDGLGKNTTCYEKKDALLIPRSDFESGPLPGALVVRKLECPVDIERGSCLCLYREKICPELSKNCTTLTYNHLIMDFGRVKMKLENIGDYTVDKDNSLIDGIICKYFDGLLNYWTVDKFHVDFLHKDCDYDGYEWVYRHLGYKSKACTCMLPRYRVEKFVSVKNRVMVTRVLVFFVRSKTYPNRLHVFTSFDEEVQYKDHKRHEEKFERELTPINDDDSDSSFNSNDLLDFS